MYFKLSTFALLASLVFSVSTPAQTLKATPSDIIFEDVVLTNSITLDENATQTTLGKVSYGLRKVKKYGLITVSVYVIEFFAKDSTKLNKTNDGILNSLKSAGPIQLRLTVARDLKGSQISDSFSEALKVNGVDTANTTPELTAVLKAINEITKFKKGEVFSLTAQWKDNNATLLIQKPDQSIQKITGPDKFVIDLFSIWFGKSADEKLEDLKKTLLK